MYTELLKDVPKLIAAHEPGSVRIKLKELLPEVIPHEINLGYKEHEVEFIMLLWIPLISDLKAYFLAVK